MTRRDTEESDPQSGARGNESVAEPAPAGAPASAAQSVGAPEFLRLTEAAAHLGLQADTLYTWCSLRDPRWFDLQPVKLWGRWRFQRERLDALLAKETVPATGVRMARKRRAG